MSHIKTYSRVKPSLDIYEDIDVVDNDLLLRVRDAVQYYTSTNRGQNKITHQFHFDHVFQQEASQEEVFNKVAVDIVDAFLNGYNGTIFAYGQTGTGKTYTVEGGAQRYSERGLASRAVSRVYQTLEHRCDEEVSVKVSFLEIYQEVGYDLLNPAARGNWVVTPFPRVTVMEGSGGSCLIRNLTTHLAASEEVAQNLLLQGQANRKVAETPVNQRSSRSHAVFTISLTCQKPNSDIVIRSKLHLVDLAGSERVAKTGVDGQQLSEAKSINLSLHHLESVIIALQASSGDKRQNRKGSCDWMTGDLTLDPYTSPKHVPYRNSLLTMVLRDSLGGNCLTAMIATVSLEWENLGETISTCRFAQRVACISNSVRRNEEIDDKSLVKILRKKIAELETEIAFLKTDQGSEEETENMSAKLSAEDKMRCAQIIHDYIMGRLRDPVTAGITSPFKFRECLKILKSMVKESALEVNGNSVDVHGKTPHRTNFGTSRPPLTRLPSDSSQSHHQQTGPHLHARLEAENANVQNHTRPQLKSRSQSLSNLEMHAVVDSPKQKCLTRTQSESPSGECWTTGKLGKKRPHSAQPHVSPSCSHNSGRVCKKSRSPNEQKSNSNSPSGIDITEGDLNNTQVVELLDAIEILKEKHALVESQRIDLGAHIRYLQGVRAEEADLIESYQLGKRLRKRQTSICSRLEKVYKKLAHLSTHNKIEKSVPSTTIESRQEKFGQHRKNDGCLNTREVYEKLQSDIQQNKKVHFQEDVGESASRELDQKVEATRQKLSHFKKLLSKKDGEENPLLTGNENLCHESRRLFSSPPHTSTPNGSRTRAIEMNCRRKRDNKNGDLSVLRVEDLESFHLDHNQSGRLGDSAIQSEDIRSGLSSVPNTTGSSGPHDNCDTAVSSPSNCTKQAHVSSNNLDILDTSNGNKLHDVDSSPSTNKHMYLPSESGNQFDKQAVFDVHQMGLFSKTFESALQSMLERDNAKLFSHKSYDQYARQRSPYETYSEKNHRSTSDNKSQPRVSKKRNGGVAGVLEPYRITSSVSSQKYITDLTNTSTVLPAESTIGRTYRTADWLPRTEYMEDNTELKVKATPEEERETSFMAKAKEQKNRIEKIRKAQHSASIIQRCWRHYCDRRTMSKA